MVSFLKSLLNNSEREIQESKYVGITAVPADSQFKSSKDLQPDRKITSTSISAQKLLDSGKRLIGYFNNSDIYERNFEVAMLPLNQLTHVHYAHLLLNEDGIVSSSDLRADFHKPYGSDTNYFGSIRQLNRVLKPVHPHLKTLISIGTWSPDIAFGSIIKDAKLVGILAKNIVAFMDEHEFDGVDILWKYPLGSIASQYTTEDGNNLLRFCQVLRSEMSQLEKMQVNQAPYLISLCLPVELDTVDKIPVRQLKEYVDYFSITGFNLRGPTWCKVTGNTCPLYPDNQDPMASAVMTPYEALVIYLKNGCPPEKLNLSSSCSGFGFSGLAGDAANRPQNGRAMYAKFSSIPKGTWDDDFHATGAFDFSDIAYRWLLQPYKGFQIRWDEVSKASFLTGTQDVMINNQSQETSIFVTYEDAKSASEKMKLVNYWNLGGMTIWDLAADLKPEFNLSILNGIFSTILTKESTVPMYVPHEVPYCPDMPVKSSWWPF